MLATECYATFITSRLYRLDTEHAGSPNELGIYDFHA